MSFSVEEEELSRPRLSLKPRSSSSGPPSADSNKSTRPNPFGAARPKEQVIAEREGKNETQVLREQATREWRLQAALTEMQLEEKKAAEAELSFAKSELEKEIDSGKAAQLAEEIAIREKSLQELLASFEKLAAQPAPSVVTKHIYENRQDENSFAGNPHGKGYAGREVNYGEGVKAVSSYGETWGGGRKPGKQAPCYTCGEVGHFSRDCPQGGTHSGGGGYGGKDRSRACYTCGQSGHFSRDCPQGGGQSYGSRGASYGIMGGPPLSYGYGAGPAGYDSGNRFDGPANY